MPAWPELQGRMAARLLATAGPNHACRGEADPVGTDLLAAVCAGAGPTPAARLAVYRSNVRSALVQALRLTFPTVDWLVGEDFFDSCAEAYIQAAPPNQAFLTGWGDTFDRLLQNDPRTAGLPYLPEVARLDFALDTAFHAREAPRLGALDLARISPAEYGALALEPHPSLRVLDLRYPVQAIRQARVEGDAERLGGLDLTPGHHALLIERHPADGVCLRPLEPGEAVLTLTLMGGSALADALELATGRQGDFDPMPLLVEHLVRGRFTAARPIPTPPAPQGLPS